MTRGFGVATVSIGRLRSASPFSRKCRRRSPSVKIPTTFPFGSTTVQLPARAAVILSRASRTEVPLRTSGFAFPFRMMSPTLRSLFPRLPPGCNAAKSSGRNFLILRSVSASASPIASAAVVDAEGARLRGQASFVTPRSSTTSACLASVDFGMLVIAMSGTPFFLRIGRSLTISAVSPLWEIAMMRSWDVTIPRSP